ncbi:hypothetical protein PENSTE_c014G07793 [Penicillium steckii]|uniref:Ecp2 effector protein domain-containing protein n=1 Tax=Penicillium steckii TaxID=303698 RepID=A0A1V6T181_9EURO|nr:hypothetical protein PENSTE_c014G07793 [Penicillium steckii]
MAPTNALKALCLSSALFASFGYCGQVINAVWSSTAFNTISGPSGSETSYGEGFALIKDDGTEIWSTKEIDGGTGCMGIGDGTIFSLTDGCFEGEFRFKCKSAFDGHPKDCSVLDKFANEINSGIGGVDTSFIGISIGQDGHCGTSFELKDGVECGEGTTGFTVKRLLN